MKRWTEVKAPKETRKAGQRWEGEWHDAILFVFTWGKECCIVALGTFRLANLVDATACKPG